MEVLLLRCFAALLYKRLFYDYLSYLRCCISLIFDFSLYDHLPSITLDDVLGHCDILLDWALSVMRYRGFGSDRSSFGFQECKGPIYNLIRLVS